MSNRSRRSKAMATCPECSGRGNFDCDNCRASGIVVCSCCATELECDECEGTTVIDCEYCGGSGEIPVEEYE